MKAYEPTRLLKEIVSDEVKYMPIAKELGLRPGDPFSYKNEAGIQILGTVYQANEKETVIWVQWCNSSAPIDELFEEGKHRIPADDSGFSHLPKLEK